MTRSISTQRATQSRADIGGLGNYFRQSELPLTSLLFLIPFIVLYEIGTLFLETRSQLDPHVLAFSYMRQFMELFGASGRFLPCGALIGILLAWHIARKDPWTVHIGAVSFMFLECALLAIPVLTLSRHVPLLAANTSVQSGMILALGAGLYEELLFRLIAITLLNMLLVDLIKIRKSAAYLLMVFGPAILFALYHYWSPVSAPFRWSDFVFRTGSGAYFALLFMSRGFGVTAGSHAIYDVYYFLLRAGG